MAWPLELLAELHLKAWSLVVNTYSGMLSRGPNGMRPLYLLAEMQVKDWSFSSTIAEPP